MQLSQYSTFLVQFTFVYTYVYSLMWGEIRNVDRLTNIWWTAFMTKNGESKDFEMKNITMTDNILSLTIKVEHFFHITAPFCGNKHVLWVWSLCQTERIHFFIHISQAEKLLPQLSPFVSTLYAYVLSVHQTSYKRLLFYCVTPLPPLMKGKWKLEEKRERSVLKWGPN